MSNSNDPSFIRRISSSAGIISEKIINLSKELEDEFKNFDKLIYEENKNTEKKNQRRR